MSDQFPQTTNDGIDDLLGAEKSQKSDFQKEQLIFYSHSQIFYFWPVWLFAFIFAGITYFSSIDFIGKTSAGKEVVVKMVGSPALGLSFLVILLSVIIFTSIDIRGIWTASLTLLFILFCLIFYILSPEKWSAFLRYIGHLNIFMNFYFYLVTGIVMSALWVITFFLYDKRHYIVFRPAQLTIVEEIGEGEKNYDTMGLVFDKKRDNFFQHYILGFGSGDLVIIPAGGKSERIQFSNVMQIGHRLNQIHRLRERRGR